MLNIQENSMNSIVRLEPSARLARDEDGVTTPLTPEARGHQRAQDLLNERTQESIRVPPVELGLAPIMERTSDQDATPALIP